MDPKEQYLQVSSGLNRKMESSNGW